MKHKKSIKHHAHRMEAKMHHSPRTPSEKGTSEHEGHYMGQGEFANMPQHPIFMDYPHLKSGDDHLDDTMVRIDSDSVQAERRIRKNLDRGMY